MASVGNINVNLTANIAQFQSAMQKASDTIQKFGYAMNGRITQGLVDPLKKAKFEFKDVARIVGGIVISKIFYSGLNAIRNATDAVIEFRQELEYTQTAFANLFDSADMAEELVNVLKDFSAVSPFDFGSSAKAAQRLLAYGIKAKNVMYVMQGVMNAATMQGDASKIESISRALGQIYTKGTLKAEELRQLAEAGIPAYEILAEKLNLSEKAMSNIGKAAIPANVAINALVDGINERFAGMAVASTMTMKGMMSNIKDNALMLMSGVFDPLYQQVRTLTKKVNDFFSAMYQLYELKGLGGIFEHIFPDERDQQDLRQFVAILQEFGAILLDVGRNITAVFGASLRQLINIVNAIGPYFILAGQVIQLFVREVRQCEPVMKALTVVLAAAAGAFMVFKAAALAAFILRPLTKVVMLCAKAFAFLAAVVTAHPLVLGLILLGGAIAGLAATSTKAGEAVRNFGLQLTKWLGIDPGTKILPDTKKRTADINKFNEALDTTSSNLDKTGDAADKAAKKAKKARKDLLSFDEVFRLNDDNDEVTNPDADIPDWELGDFDFGDMDIDEPVLPDFANLWESAFQKQLDKIKQWAKNLWQRICDALGINDPDTALFTTAMGAAIAAILAALLGASWWEVLLAGLLGGIAGMLWEKIAEAFGMDEAQKHQAAICTAFGLAFGALIGALLGLPALGVVITALAGGLVAEIWSGIADKLGLTPEAKYSALIAAGIAAMIGAAFRDPVISMVIGQLAPGLWKVMQAALGGATAGQALFNTATTAGLIGTWIAAVVQGIQTGDWSGLIPAIAGTLGRLALGPLGGWAGMIAGYLYNATFKAIQDEFGVSNMAKIGDLILAGFNGIITGLASWMIPIISPLGTSIGSATAQALTNGIKGGIAGIITSLLASALSNVMLKFMGESMDLTDQDIKNGKIGGQIGGVCGSIIGGIVGFFLGGPAGAAIGMAVGNGIGQPLGTAIGALWETKISPALSTMGAAISDFFTNTLPTELGKAGTAISTSVGNVKNAFGTFFTEDLPNALSTAGTSIAGSLSNMGSSIGNFFTSTLPSTFSKIHTAISTFFTETLPNAIGYGLGFVTGKIARGLVDIGKALGKFFTETMPVMVGTFIVFLYSIPGKIQGAIDSIWNGIKAWAAPVLQSIGKFFTETIPVLVGSVIVFLYTLPGKIQEAINAIWSGITTWASGVISAIGTFFTTTLPVAIGTIFVFLATLPGKIQAAISTAWGVVTQWAGGVIQSISTFFTVTIPMLFMQFLQFLGSIPEKVKEIGANIIAGLIQGIQNAWGTVIECISNFVSGFIQGFKDGFGIASPSTVFAEIGDWIIQGLLGGLTAAWETVTGWISGAVSAFIGFFSQIGGAVVNFATTAKGAISGFVSQAGANISSWVSTTQGKIGSWVSTCQGKIGSWVSTTQGKILSWASTTQGKVLSWASTTQSKVLSWASATQSKINSWATNTGTKISTWASTTKTKISGWKSSAVQLMNSAMTSIQSKVNTTFNNVVSTVNSKLGAAKSAISSFVSAVGSMLSSISSRISSVLSSALSAASQAASALAGHATGGVFNREHIARISEGNKAEAIIPLEDKNAMQPFVDAVSAGLSQYLGPMMANMTNAIAGSSMQAAPVDAPPIMYVGTLIADDRSLRELQRKMDVIQMKETRRRS